MENSEKLTETRDTGVEIMFAELCKSFLKKLWIVILAAAVAASFAFISAKSSTSSAYISSFKNYFYTEPQLVEAKNGSLVTAPNSVDANGLVKLYNYIATNDVILDRVAEAAGVELKADEIKRMISLVKESDSTIVTVTVKGNDPETVTAIADALNEITTNEVTEKIRNSRVQTLVSPAAAELHVSGKNAVKSAVLLGGLVFVLSSIVVILVEISMDKIKNPAQLERRFGIVVLGSVPESKQLSKRR